MTSLHLWFLWMATASAGTFDIDALCRASQTFGMPGTRVMSLPDASGGSPVSGKDPSVRVAEDHVFTLVARRPMTHTDADVAEMVEQLQALDASRDEPLPIAIDLGATTARVQQVAGWLSGAGFRQVAVVARAGAITVPEAPVPSLASELQAALDEADRSGSFRNQLKVRGQLMVRANACPGGTDHLQSMLSTPYPQRCGWLKEHPFPLSGCDGDQQGAALTTLRALLVYGDAMQLGLHVFDLHTLATAANRGQTFGEVWSSLMTSP